MKHRVSIQVEKSTLIKFKAMRISPLETYDMILNRLIDSYEYKYDKPNKKMGWISD